jgi:glycosyltransferase involved in cell wall biosynthesis
VRLVSVLPVHTSLEPDAAIDAWTTSTRLLEELAATGEVEPVGVAWGDTPATVARAGVRHEFVPELASIAQAVRDAAPDTIHVHGTRSARLIAQLRRTVGRAVPIVVQHHGEPPASGVHRLAQRAVSRHVDGWAFTGADHGQAAPFRRAGVIRRGARLFDVVEAGCTLPVDDGAPAVALAGSPAVLWVGRLVEGKDPLTAVRVLAAAASSGDPHLHVLVTDRTLEHAVVQLAERLHVAGRLHLHDAVDRAAMHSWYRGADVLLSTSRHEGSNYSLIEALHHGCAPVVTDIPPHRSIVGDLAPTFAAGDAAAAAQALVRGVLARDAVVESAIRRLSWPAIARQVEAMHRLLLSSTRRY